LSFRVNLKHLSSVIDSSKQCCIFVKKQCHLINIIGVDLHVFCFYTFEFRHNAVVSSAFGGQDNVSDEI
jgi:hypothetical protein